ncbi:MAG: ABC transporter permease [Planctomycetes bacterium]|nr:ABC transporter permease [Planctomycetota bacterium]
MKFPHIRDPVTAKELWGLSRLRRTHAARLIYVGLIGAVLFQFSASMAGPVVSPSEYANLGRNLFQYFFWPNLFLVSLASVIAAADIFAREVKADTLEILMLTPLTPFEVAFGKWKAVMVQTGTIILCGAPVAAVCLYLGGIGYWEVAWSLSLTAAMAALGAAMALYFSARHMEQGRAVVVSMLLLAALSIPFVSIALAVWMGARSSGMILVVLLALTILMSCFCFSPYLVPVHTAVAAFGSNPDAYSYAWISATALSFGAAFLLLRMAAESLRWLPNLAPAPARSTDLEAGNPYSFISLPGLGDREIRRSVWEDHPLLWKELATRAAARLRPITKIYIQILLYLGLGILFLVDWGRSLEIFYVLWLSLVLLAVMTGASLFVSDKRGRKFEVLMCTSLTTARIVLTKLLSGWLSPESKQVLILWLLVSIGWSWRGGAAWMVGYLVTAGIFIAFVYTLAATVSLRTRTVQGAFVFTAAVLGTLLVGGNLIRSGTLSPQGASGVAAVVLDAFSLADPGDIFSRLTPQAAAWPSLFPRLGVYAGLYLAAVLLLFLGMVRGFRTLGERV